MLFRYGNKVYDVYTCVEPACGKYAGGVPDNRIVYEIFDIPASIYPKVKAAVPEGVEVDFDDFDKVNYDPYDHFSNEPASWTHTAVPDTQYTNSTDYIKNLIDDIKGFPELALKSDSELGGGNTTPVQEAVEDQFELDLDFPDVEDDDVDIDSLVKDYNSEDFFNLVESGEIQVNDESIELEGDFAWMIGYAWMDLYQQILVKDAINSIDFKKYLKQNSINLTDTMAVCDFTDFVFKYLDKKIQAAPTIGYKFHDGTNHGLLCNVPNHGTKIIYISLDEDPYVSALNISDFKAYVDYGMQKTFGIFGLGKWTDKKITETDTVANLIDKLVEAWGENEI